MTFVLILHSWNPVYIDIVEFSYIWGSKVIVICRERLNSFYTHEHSYCYTQWLFESSQTSCSQAVSGEVAWGRWGSPIHHQLHHIALCACFFFFFLFSSALSSSEAAWGRSGSPIHHCRSPSTSSLRADSPSYHHCHFFIICVLLLLINIIVIWLSCWSSFVIGEKIFILKKFQGIAYIRFMSALPSSKRGLIFVSVCFRGSKGESVSVLIFWECLLQQGRGK